VPNGGSDNCGTCVFNDVNEGKTAAELPEARQNPRETARCLVRGVEIAGPWWTYCANHNYHNPNRVRTPVGPVYTCFVRYSPRVIQAPCPDTPDTRAGLLALLNEMPEKPVGERSTATRFDDEVIKQLMKFGETRAVEGLKRIARFDPLASSDGDPGRALNRVSTVAWAVEALGVLAGDDALPELEAALSAGLEKGRLKLSDRTKELAEIRRRAVRGLTHCSSPDAGKLLRRGALDPVADVAELAVESWFSFHEGAACPPRRL
jgi:hypothetical protein